MSEITARMAESNRGIILCPLCGHEAHRSEKIAVAGNTAIRVCSACADIVLKLEEIRSRLHGTN